MNHTPSLRTQHIFEDGYEGGLGEKMEEIVTF